MDRMGGLLDNEDWTMYFALYLINKASHNKSENKSQPLCPYSQCSLPTVSSEKDHGYP